MIKSLCEEDASQVSPTLGFNICELDFEDIRVMLWDVGGQKSLRCCGCRSLVSLEARSFLTCRPYWRNYFEETDGLVWVVDSADHCRLVDCARELHLLLQVGDVGRPACNYEAKTEVTLGCVHRAGGATCWGNLVDCCQ